MRYPIQGRQPVRAVWPSAVWLADEASCFIKSNFMKEHFGIEADVSAFDHDFGFRYFTDVVVRP